MAVQVICGKTYDTVRVALLEEVRQNMSLDKINYIIVPDNLVQMAKREVAKLLGGCAFNIKVLSLLQFANEFVPQNKTLLTNEQSLFIFKSVIKQNAKQLKSFGKIVDNDGAIREIFAMLNTLAQSNIDPNKLTKAGEKIGGILGSKVVDIAYLYDKFYSEIKDKYLDKHIIFDAFAKCNLSENIKDNVNVYLLDFSLMTAEQIGCLRKIAMSQMPLSIGIVCNQNAGNSRIYPRFLTDFCKNLSKNYGLQVEISNAQEDENALRTALLDNLYAYNIASQNIDNNIEVCSAQDIALEIKGVCRKIRQAVVEGGKRYKDICIFCSDIAAYSRDIQRQFDIFEIPYFLKKKKELISFDIAKLFVSCLQVLESGFACEEVLIFSKNTLLDIDKDDRNSFELYVRKYNIDTIQFLTDFEQTDDMLCESANAVRQKIVVYCNALLGNSDNLSVQNIKDFYQVVLGEDGYEKYLANLLSKEGETAKRNAESACTKMFEILEQIGVFELQNNNKTQNDFCADNKTCQIDDKQIAKECNIGGQDFALYKDIVYSIQNTKIGTSKHFADSIFITDDKKQIENRQMLFVIGANDGVLVRESNGIGLFTYNELVRLEQQGVQFTPSVMEINYNEKFEVVQLFAKCEKMIVTYNQATGEQSIIVKDLCKLLNINEKSLVGDNNEIDMDFAKYAVKIGTKSNAKQELAHYYSERMRGIATGKEDVFDYLYTKLDGAYNYQNIIKQKDFKYVKENTLGWSKSEDKTFASISAVERYFDCPFKFFCDRVLKLKNVQKGGLDIASIGSFMHRILEKFFRNYKDFEMSEDYVYQIADELCDSTIKEAEFELISKSYSEKVLQNSLFKKVKYVLWKLVQVAKRSDFETASTELTFGFDWSKLPPYELKLDGKSYFVRGKIDRVDKFGDYIAIIDYKTKSSVKYSIKEIYYGERLQLLIYLNAYMSNFDIRPFALLYMPLPYSYAKEEANSAFKYSGLVMDLDEAIQHFDSGFEEKATCALPLNYNTKGQVTDKDRLKQDELKILREYADKVVAQAISEIESGYIEAKAESCDNCEYGRICLKKNNPQNMRKKYSKKHFSIVAKEEDGNG